MCDSSILSENMFVGISAKVHLPITSEELFLRMTQDLSDRCFLLLTADHTDMVLFTSLPGHKLYIYISNYRSTINKYSYNFRSEQIGPRCEEAATTSHHHRTVVNTFPHSTTLVFIYASHKLTAMVGTTG